MKGKEGVCAVGKARAEEIGSPPKEAGDGEGDVATEGGGGGGEGGLKSLLTLWREKVFALLVQARLTQMQHEQELINTRARVSHSCRPFSGTSMHRCVLRPHALASLSACGLTACAHTCVG